MCKVKVKALCLEDLSCTSLSNTPLRRMGERSYSSTHSKPRHYTEVRSQLHDTAALPRGKKPLVPTG